MRRSLQQYHQRRPDRRSGSLRARRSYCDRSVEGVHPAMMSRRNQAACRPRDERLRRATSKESRARKASFTDFESGNRAARSGSIIRSKALAFCARTASRPRCARDQSYRSMCPSGSFLALALFIFSPVRGRRAPCADDTRPTSFEVLCMHDEENPQQDGHSIVMCRSGRIKSGASTARGSASAVIASSKVTPCLR